MGSKEAFVFIRISFRKPTTPCTIHGAFIPLATHSHAQIDPDEFNQLRYDTRAPKFFLNRVNKVCVRVCVCVCVCVCVWNGGGYILFNMLLSCIEVWCLLMDIMPLCVRIRAASSYAEFSSYLLYLVSPHHQTPTRIC